MAVPQLPDAPSVQARVLPLRGPYLRAVRDAFALVGLLPLVAPPPRGRAVGGDRAAGVAAGRPPAARPGCAARSAGTHRELRVRPGRAQVFPVIPEGRAAIAHVGEFVRVSTPRAVAA